LGQAGVRDSAGPRSGGAREAERLAEKMRGGGNQTWRIGLKEEMG
jgi:hypothetical protein